MRASCHWFVLSVFMSAYILVWLGGCTVSGINTVCVSITMQHGRPIVFCCCVMLKLQALFHAVCTPLRVQRCTTYARMHCSKTLAIYSSDPQGQKKLLVELIFFCVMSCSFIPAFFERAMMQRWGKKWVEEIEWLESSRESRGWRNESVVQNRQ